MQQPIARLAALLIESQLAAVLPQLMAGRHGVWLEHLSPEFSRQNMKTVHF